MAAGPTAPDSKTLESANNVPKSRLFAGAVPRLVASLLIAVGFIWLLARGGLPLVPSRATLAKIPLWSVASFVLLQMGTIFLRTYRWVFLLRPIAPRLKPTRVVGIGMVGFSAIFLAPLRMGEIVRPYLIAQDGEVTFLQASGSVFAERVIDGVVLTLAAATAMSLATTVSPLPKSLGSLPLPLATVPAAIYTATLAFVGLFVVMIAFYAARERARRVTLAVVGLVSKRAALWAAGTLERVADGLRFLPSRANLVPFLLATLSCWLLTIVSHWVMLRGAGLPASFGQATALVGILALGVVVPAGPGLFGTYQIASFSALALFFPLDQVRSVGAALIFVSYVVSLVLSSLQCVVGFWLMARADAAAA
jgi:uncharacterized protein (TIRG00374 family)